LHPKKQHLKSQNSKNFACIGKSFCHIKPARNLASGVRKRYLIGFAEKNMWMWEKSGKVFDSCAMSTPYNQSHNKEKQQFLNSLK